MQQGEKQHSKRLTVDCFFRFTFTSCEHTAWSAAEHATYAAASSHINPKASSAASDTIASGHLAVNGGCPVIFAGPQYSANTSNALQHYRYLTCLGGTPVYALQAYIRMYKEGRESSRPNWRCIG